MYILKKRTIKSKECLYISNDAFKYNDNIYYSDALYYNLSLNKFL